MQRQSLGSPSSKDESQSSASTVGGEECQQQEEDELKKLKLKTSMPQSYIHLIPLLTLLCFLILYLSSHNPSLNDLADFNSFKAVSYPAENISESQGILEIEKGDVLAIRSLKQEAKHRRLHRKIPHY
ncbi:hypothetical protein AAHA92_00433 [Salvia divinorum]|uniref:Uncharacterized protein n=1 Tax=Salvia divinorum TaxID=28513 RepID=A0ABD1IJK0_SALDI